MIVSNTTPLSCLLKIGNADLLRRLYGTLTIPHEVAGELDEAGSVHDGWRRQLDFVQIVECAADETVMTLLTTEVDVGEAAAIALASRLGADLSIVDDMAGRRLARRLGLTITGTVGVILAAVERGYIDEPFGPLHDLRIRGGLWLSDSFLADLYAAWSARS